VTSKRLLQDHPERGVSQKERRFCKKLIDTETARYKAECQSELIEAIRDALYDCEVIHLATDCATEIANRIIEGKIPHAKITYQEWYYDGNERR
jgi:hypothetical protein